MKKLIIIQDEKKLIFESSFTVAETLLVLKRIEHKLITGKYKREVSSRKNTADNPDYN